jgi:hypothetical protein
MEERSRKPSSHLAHNAGPVQPGTPLYRLMELIARAIAQDLERDQYKPETGSEDRPEPDPAIQVD